MMVGCSSDDDNPASASDPEAPDLPPIASMQVDLNLFDTGSQSPLPRPATVLAKHNWWAAATRVWVIGFIVDLAVIPPSLAFAVAVGSTPSYIGEDTWLWIYTHVEQSGNEVQIRLKATELDEGIAWELRVTDANATPPLDQDLWFNGETHNGGTEGFWIFYDLGEEPFAEALRIDWDYNAEDDRELIIENIQQGGADFGDTLSYLVDGTTISMMCHDESKEIDADITWDEETHAGSIMVPGYNNGERACWDENLEDTVCGL
jgi:hypothetical protein